MRPTTPGFYWIRETDMGHVTVAHFGDGRWSFVGTTHDMREADFAEGYEVIEPVVGPNATQRSNP